MIHHKLEDHVAKLADPAIAMNYPLEWQAAENLVYCDFLEHLLLHILICETYFENAAEGELVGIGGILQYFVPEFNDAFSGWKAAHAWKETCYKKVINDKDVYLLLIKRLKENCKDYPFFHEKFLLCSASARYGTWDQDKNKALYEEIKAL